MFQTHLIPTRDWNIKEGYEWDDQLGVPNSSNPY